jgi:paraquat-inducible protein A
MPPPLTLPSTLRPDPAGRLEACHECDALQQSPPAKPGDVVCCWRCGASLNPHGNHGPHTSLALTLGATVLFLLANSFPIVDLELSGQHQSTSLWGAVQTLWSQDVPPLALIVLATTLLAPALDLAAMLWLLVPLALGHPPWMGRLVLRSLTAVRPWGMVEVFVLGTLVAVVKLAHLAAVVPGVALWSFGALIVVLCVANSGFDFEQAWHRLSAAPR